MRVLSAVLPEGAGFRLWPASRQAFPKPFMNLGSSSLLQQAIEREQPCGTGDPMIVTNKGHRFLTKDALGLIADLPDATLLLKPKGRSGRCRYIPLREKHRLTNNGNEEFVEVQFQCDEYSGEDDIVRLADTYGLA